MNIKRRPLVKLLLAVALFMFMFILAACDDTQESDGGSVDLPRTPILEEQDKTQATVYYTTSDPKWRLPLTLPIQATREVAKVAMERLLAGPPNDWASSVIPADVKLLDLYSSGEYVYVNLTEPFASISPENAPLAVESIAATILPLVKGYSLKIMVNNKTLTEIGDYTLPEEITWSAANIVDKEAQGVNLIVYFSDANAMYLVPQSYTIPAEEVPDEDFATMLTERTLQLLLAGPDAESGLQPTLWPGTQLLDCTVSNGLATVNFSGDIIQYGGGHAAESMFVDSVLYTVTAVPGVSEVQILIDGEKVEFLPEGTEISTPLKPTNGLNMVLD